MQDRLSDEQYAFIIYLTGLKPENDRGALAVLRRGASGNPAEDLNAYRFVARRIPDTDRGTPRETLYYLVAALYALNPLTTGSGDFGAHMKQAAGLRRDSEAAERRFTALINNRLEDLSTPLRQAVMMLKQLDLPINWTSLFSDLLYWKSTQKTVQRRWANSFWAYEPPVEPKSNSLQEEQITGE